MGLLDIFKIFKKKKQPEKKKEEKIEKDKPKPVKKSEDSARSSAERSRVSLGKNFAWKVLTEPHVTEKATDLEKSNKYVFKVFKTANKPEIKKAVEGLYRVSVADVKIVNIPKKKRRVRRKTEGFRKGYKKAIVKLREGDKIEIMPR